MSSSAISNIFASVGKSSSPTSTRRHSVSTSNPHVASIIKEVESRWEEDHPSQRVKLMRVPDILSRPVGCQNAWSAGSSQLVATSVDFVPCVVVPGMPTSAYPKYMREMVGYTLAATAAKSPHMATSLSQPKMCHLVATVTAVRLGAWSAMNALPLEEAQTHISALHWSKKSARLYLKAATSGDDSDLWRFFLGYLTKRMAGESDLAMALCVLAPLFLQMGASSHTQSGEAYATQYVERAISGVLKARLKPDVYANASLASKSTWEGLREASLTGMCANAVRAWASDSLLSAGANYRMATRESEAKHWSDRETAIREGAAGATPALPDDTPAASDDLFSSQFLTASSHAAEDDTVSVVDTVFGESPERDSASDNGDTATQVPSPGTQTPVRPQMGSADAQQIREVVMHAHVNSRPAASAFGGFEDAESLRF